MALPGSSDIQQLQTLLATFQQTNQALANIAQILANSPALVAFSPSNSAINLGIYANDAAAAAAGVALHGLYLNSTTFALTARHV